MGFGDLTSGVNMLPDDSINQGFRNLASSLGQIEQIKTEQAKKNIDQFNQLASVSLKGLEADAMDEGVAARDNMVKKLAQWYATDGPMGLSWEHQKEALAMKDNLENMVTQSQENKKLLMNLHQQALQIKDPKTQSLFLKKIDEAAKAPTVAAKYQALSSLAPPKQAFSLSKALNEYKTTTKDQRDFSLRDAAEVYKGQYESGDYHVTGVVDDWLKQNPDKTPEDAFNYLANLRKDLIPKTLSIREKNRLAQEGKNDANRDTKITTLNPRKGNPNVIDMRGKKHLNVDKFAVYVTETDPKTEKTVKVKKTFRGGQIIEARKDTDGKKWVTIAYNKSSSDGVSKDAAGVFVFGDGSAADNVDVPFDQYINYFRNNKIHFGADWAEQEVWGNNENPNNANDSKHSKALEIINNF